MIMSGRGGLRPAMGRPLSPLARRLGLRVGRRGAGCLAHSDAVTCSIYRWRPDENLAWGIVRQAQQDTEYSPLWGAGGRVICEPRGREGCASFALPEWGAASTLFCSRSYSARRPPVLHGAERILAIPKPCRAKNSKAIDAKE